MHDFSKLKVLFLPYNIASKASTAIDALNRIEGIQAKGLFLGGSSNQTIGSNVTRLDPVPFGSNPLKWISHQVTKAHQFERLIRWADVVHWIWDSAFAGQLDLRYAAWLKKPGIIEWSGSDIRYPEKAIALNPYMQDIYEKGYEYAHIESKENSDRVQERFARVGFYPLTTPEMNLYLRNDLFPHTYSTLHRMDLASFSPVLSNNARPVLVHAPTKRFAKGTPYIIEAVDALRQELDFEFVLLENLPRKEALRQVQHCDIFIDQLMLGSHGLASCEAMAFGKPVLCYIMPAVYTNGLPASCPIVNTTKDNIKEKLRELILDKTRREVLGKQGRHYAETYLDADKAAARYVDMYREIIERNKNKRN